MAVRLFLVDAYALIYRSYFAFVNRPLTNAEGENTSAPYGFANFLHSLRDEHSPDRLAIVFDSGRSHREELYPEYKATRARMPEDLRASLPRIRELAAAFGAPVVEVEGWEADDVIGTMAARAAADGIEAVIVSGDKDFIQLVGGRVRLLNPGRGGPGGVAEHWLDAEAATRKLGVEPRQVVDYLAMVGDASDNVPGAPGIGPKTARKLLAEHGTLDEVLAHAHEIKAKRPRESLLAHRDAVLLSRELVTIRTDLDLPPEAAPERLKVAEPDWKRVRDLYVALEFRSLLDRLKREATALAPAAEAAVAEHVLVTDAADLAGIAEACRHAGRMGVAVLNATLETTRGKVAGMAIAAEAGRCHYLPVAHGAEHSLGLEGSDGDANLPPLDDAAWDPIREVLADPAVAKVGHDLKRSLIACRRAGIAFEGAFDDVMVASYVLAPGRRQQDLAALASDFLGRELAAPGKVLGTGRKRRLFGDLPAARVLDYACEQAEAPLALWEVLSARMADQGLEDLFRGIEAPLIPVLAAMEMHGVLVDPGFFAQMSARLVRELRLVREDIHRAAGVEFNINSTPQLREILFERLGLPVKKRTRTGPSTDSTVLEELAVEGHELPRLMLDYRQLEKLRNTYVDALPALVHRETGRIHTTFNQAVAATGRLSSSDPNLQNIPIRTPLGREIRRGFTAPEGSVLLTADYSQIELRILAHFSEDEVFLRAFREGKDVHRETAAVVFGVPVEEVTGEQRDQAKTVNFATLYGQGPFGLARQLGIGMGDAKRFIERYFERFSGVRRFLDQQVEQARASGYVETLLGRRRHIPELRARVWHQRQFGERVAQNTPIQGTAADLIKKAMIGVADALQGDSDAVMLLQVHDELVFEVADERVPDVTRTVVGIMESALELRVPLKADVGTGRTWYDCKG